jgi:hypothetical protein
MRPLMLMVCFLGVLAIGVALSGCGDTKNANPAVEPQQEKDSPGVKPISRPKPIVENN